MKLSLHSSAVTVALAASILLLFCASSSHANPYPLFGETLTINGVAFSCVHDDGNGGTDYNTTEDGGYHVAVYNATGGNSGQLTVRGKIGAPNLATVVGDSGGVTFDGFLQNGVYGDRVQSSSGDVSLDFNGNHYSTVSTTTTYTVDVDAGTLTSATTSIYNGSGVSFTVAPDGSLSGTEHGFYVNGQWYVDSGGTWGTTDLTLNGHHYTQHRVAGITVYTRDGDGNISSGAVLETYTGADGLSFTIDNNGAISGSESGYYGNGNWYVNGSSYTPYPNGTGGNLTLFGSVYTHTGTSSTWEYTSASGSCNSSTSEEYSSAEGGSATIWSSTSGTITSSGMSGWDYYVGNFSGDSSGNVSSFNSQRSSPSFVGSQIWLNDMVMNWQSGSVDVNGTVADTYAGSDAQGTNQTVVLSGFLRGFMVDGSTATVNVNGSDAGTLTQAGGFNVTGMDLQAADPNRSTPLFAPATLWINGSALSFSGGWEDSGGHRTDRYETSDGWLTFYGSINTPGSASVQVGWNGSTYSGSFNGGSFDVGEDLSISTVPPESGPPAIWVAGRLYLKQAGQNQYVCQVSETTAFHLNLSGGTDDTHFTLNGSGPGGTLMGVLDVAQGGVFLMTQNGSTPVAALAANADGTPHLSTEAPPEEFPPAVMATGRGVLGFVGTLDSGATACYTNPGALGSEEPDSGAQCLLTIGTGGMVALLDYLTDTTQTGTYSTQTHLFQTGLSDSLPVPVLAVNSFTNGNGMLWEPVSPADAGVPVSFLVGGEVWRYAGKVNGTDTYQGYYDGQTLTLGAAGAGGGRLVTVADPVHGNSSGLLSDVRAGTRLGNGVMVHSASDVNGTRTQATINNNSLAALTGNLDIPGNLLTFGALSGDAAAPGMTLQFGDSSGLSVLNQTLGRSAARWGWWRVNPADSGSFAQVMSLDSAGGLSLYDPAHPANAAIQLDPSTGTINLNGNPVLTQQSADERYVQTSQIGGGNSIILTQTQADIRYLRADQEGGPMINNSPVLNRDAGDVRYLRADQEGGPMINNSPVLNRDAGDARYLQKGQPLRVTPAGDIGMGEFTNGPQP